jgi:DNA-damage-inducible protein J
MAIKSAKLYESIEPDVKEQVEEILPAIPLNIYTLSDEQINAELEKGYADMQYGRTKTANIVFSDIRKNYKYKYFGIK